MLMLECDVEQMCQLPLRLGQIPRELARVLGYGERAALSRVCLVINIKQMPYAMLMSRCH